MRYLKALCLAGVAAAALMAWIGAGTASATIVDCTGLSPCPTNEVIHAKAESTVTLHPPFGDIECGESTVEGKLSNPGTATTTASGAISVLTFKSCNATVTVIKTGSLEIHTRTASSDNNGTLTSTGAEVTVEFIGTHCIFATNGTDLGTVTGAATTKKNATLDIEATIPRTGGRSGIFCGSTAQWTGSYEVTTPSGLNIT
jgi:hypothetical protein